MRTTHDTPSGSRRAVANASARWAMCHTPVGPPQRFPVSSAPRYMPRPTLHPPGPCRRPPSVANSSTPPPTPSSHQPCARPTWTLSAHVAHCFASAPNMSASRGPRDVFRISSVRLSPRPCSTHRGIVRLTTYRRQRAFTASATFAAASKFPQHRSPSHRKTIRQTDYTQHPPSLGHTWDVSPSCSPASSSTPRGPISTHQCSLTTSGTHVPPAAANSRTPSCRRPTLSPIAIPIGTVRTEPTARSYSAGLGCPRRRACAAPCAPAHQAAYPSPGAP